MQVLNVFIFSLSQLAYILKFFWSFWTNALSFLQTRFLITFKFSWWFEKLIKTINFCKDTKSNYLFAFFIFAFWTLQVHCFLAGSIFLPLDIIGSISCSFSVNWFVNNYPRHHINMFPRLYVFIYLYSFQVFTNA